MSLAGKTVREVPALAEGWHPTRNQGVNPSNILAGSNKTYWWRCPREHDYAKSPNARTNNGRATGRIGGCPICRSEEGGLDYWSWDRIVEIAKQSFEKKGFLPPAAYFQRNDLAMLVWCLYKHGKTWGDLRQAVGCFEDSTFVESRSGQRWLSHAEASLSNFLHARGVPHEKGRRYPKAYEGLSGRTAGFYDLHFRSTGGAEIDVEIWGDKPHPEAEERYAATRAFKERFNKNNASFLGIHHLDCHSDERLSIILLPYIGTIAPFVFEKPHDRVIQSSHWSNADELIETCRHLAAQQPDGKLPTEEWLRKRGKFANRPGVPYNTLSVYIKLWLGGMRQARSLIGQPENSTIKWNRDTALAELKKWFEKHSKSPGAIRAAVSKKGLSFDGDELRRGQNIVAAVEKHFGPLGEACLQLGIKHSRRRRKRGA